MKLRLLALGTLFAASTLSFAGANLVTNGSFETGSLDGWSKLGDIGESGVLGDAAVAPTDGHLQLLIKNFYLDYGGISQSIATVPGKSYAFTFDLAVTDFVQYVSVGFCGRGLYTYGELFGYTRFSYTVTAAGDSCDLSVSFWAYPGRAFLDNVTVSVPEPSSWALMTAGLGLVLAAVRPRCRAAPA